MKLYHTTHARNLNSIIRKGLLTSKSLQGRRAVWLTPKKLIEWAMVHVTRRHKCRIQSTVTLEVVVPREQLRRHGGGTWYSVKDIPPACIRGITTYDLVSRSRNV